MLVARAAASVALLFVSLASSLVDLASREATLCAVCRKVMLLDVKALRCDVCLLGSLNVIYNSRGSSSTSYKKK